MQQGRSPIAAYLLCFVVLGLALSMVGPAMTHLRQRAGVDLSAGGLIVAGQGVGYVVASLVIGHRLDHKGAGHRLLLQVVAGIALAAVALQAVSSLWAVIALFTAIGAGSGAMDVMCNTLLVWHEPPDRVGSRLNALHLRFGIGAIAAPLVVAVSLRATDSLALVAVALVAGAVGVWALLRHVPTPVAPARDQADTAGPTRHPAGMLVLAAAFFALYVGAEGTFGAWSTTYGEALPLGFDEAAAVLTAIYWGGFTLGRVAAVAATRVRSVDRVLTVSCLAATLAAVALTVADSQPAPTWVMVGVLGFTLGPQYATMLAVVDRRVGLDGRSASRLIGAAGTGGLIIPLATGWILEEASVGALPAIVAVTIGGATAFAIAVVVRHPPPAQAR